MKIQILLLLFILNTWEFTQAESSFGAQNTTTFKIRNTTYQLIQNGYAQKNNNDNSPDDEIKLIGKKGPYKFFVNPSLTTSQTMTLPSENSFQIVRNQRTNDIAVLTGKLVVTFKDMSQAQTIAQTYGLEISDKFELINTVFYAVGSHDLFTIAEQLRQETNAINTIEIDMIEHLDYPN